VCFNVHKWIALDVKRGDSATASARYERA
jgi:hypothetical protein